MKITDYKGFEVHLPTSGGKAGKGRAKTSSLQLRKDSCIVKQIRFELGVPGAVTAVVAKAKQWIEADLRRPPHYY